MANLSQEQAALLKQTYATAEDFQASANFKKMTPGAQKIALAAYAPVVPVATVEPVKGKQANTDPMLLQQQLDAKNTQDGTNNQSNVSTTPTATSNMNGTGVSQPETPVKEDKTNEPSKTDESTARLAEIQTNLTQYAQTQPELFTDINTYKSFFGYDQRAPEQKKILDSFFTTQQGVIAKQKANQDRYNALSTMSQSDLMNITDVNDIGLINQDPNLAQKYQQAQNNKQMLEFVYGKDFNKTPTPQIDGLDNLPDNIQQEMAAANAEITTTKNEMDKLQDTMDSTYNDLVKQYEGTGETDSYIRAKASKMNSELTDQYNDLVRKYNSQLGTASSLNAMAQATKEEETLKRQERAQNLDMFNAMYGSFADINTSSISEDKNIGKTIDLGTAKAPKIMQWNPDTQRYDIPVSSMVGTSAGGGTGTGLKGFSATDSNASIIKTILASGKFTKDQAKQLTDGINAGGDARAIALNQAKNILGATVATALTKSEQALAQMDSIQGLVAEYYRLGGKTNVFKGNYQSTLNRIGEISDPKLVNIKARIAKALQLYRNAVSGTAYSVQEGQQIADIFPGINKSQGLNDVLINAQKEAFQTDIDTTYRTALGGAYDTIKAIPTKAEQDAAKKIADEKAIKQKALDDWKAKNGFNITPPANTITTPGIYSQLVKGTKIYTFDGKQFKTLDLANKARLARRTSKGLKN